MKIAAVATTALLAFTLSVSASADGPYPAPSPKPKKLAKPRPKPTPTPSPVPFDGGGDFTAPVEAFEEPVRDTPAPEPSPTPEPRAEEPTEVERCPVDQVCDTELNLLGGASVSMTSGESGITPFFRANVAMPLWQRTMATRLLFGLDILATPGATINVLDPSTFSTLEARVGLSQRLHRVMNFSLFIEGGFGTRMGTDPAPLIKTVRWGKAGLRFGGHSNNFLALGLGPDQRISEDGRYLLAFTMGGALKLYERKEGQSLKGANAQLIGEAVLGVQQGYRQIGNQFILAPQGNYVVIAIAVGQ